METGTPPAPAPVRHAWPWFVLIAVLLGLVMAILWVSAEVRRTKERRAYIIPDSRTNSAPATPP
jgi:F0F1-type ATP synthase assembly protein I